MFSDKKGFIQVFFIFFIPVMLAILLGGFGYFQSLFKTETLVSQCREELTQNIQKVMSMVEPALKLNQAIQIMNGAILILEALKFDPRLSEYAKVMLRALKIAKNATIRIQDATIKGAEFYAHYLSYQTYEKLKKASEKKIYNIKISVYPPIGGIKGLFKLPTYRTKKNFHINDGIINLNLDRFTKEARLQMFWSQQLALSDQEPFWKYQANSSEFEPQKMTLMKFQGCSVSVKIKNFDLSGGIKWQTHLNPYVEALSLKLPAFY